jgi:hypothetical protein
MAQAGSEGELIIRLTELPKIVVQRLQTATNADHPDPDVITAFIEKSLGEHERDQVLGHLAQCRDCREVAALSFPEHEAVLPAAESTRPAWLGWPVLRWGALVACVVVVGAAVTLQRQFRTSGPAAERSNTPGVAQGALQTTSDTNPGPAANIASQASEAKADSASRGKKVEPVGRESGSLVGAAKTRMPQAFAARMKEQSPPAAAQTEVRDAQSAVARVSPSYNATDEAVPGRAKDALQPSSPGAPMSASGAMVARSSVSLAASDQGANRTALAPVELPPRWTLSVDGTLQRSRDYGRTWETIVVAGQSSFRALAADGLEIWVGGAKGALYHSSDAGQNWTQVQPAANDEALTEDIIGVEFTDRLHGIVTTSGQTKWVTADAGQNWQKQ